MTLWDLTSRETVALMGKKYGRGEWHGLGLFSHLYGTGSLEGLEASPPFRDNPALARRIGDDFTAPLPEVAAETEEEGTIKSLLTFPGGDGAESVFIPMHGHNTVCLSSQVGCKRGCTFCRTAKMGLVRDLAAGEIVSQVIHHRFRENRGIRNLVFMGMGEPFDNFDRVIKAVDILSDPRGLNIPKKFISLSTCGQAEGLDRLAGLIRIQPEGEYDLLRIAVSVNGGDNGTRSSLMPVNRIWPLERLKESLLALPQSRVKDRLYFEYVLIKGVNDGEEDARRLLTFLEGLRGHVNLIPFHGEDRVPGPEDLDRFWRIIRSGGRGCWTRKSKGRGIQAACGLLAGQGKGVL